jgi:tripartite-type tricarboxylate transporter receptor subunit TctC
MSSFTFRILSSLAFLALAATASAQTYPAKPVRLVVHNNPGSALDLIARQVAQRLSEGWNEPVVIDNRPGGGGVVGADAVAKASPDGYTLLAAGEGPITILPALSAKLPYQPARDLLPVVSLAQIDFVLVANPRTGFRSLADLVDAARQHPGKYTFASAGNGSPQQFAAELLKQNAGIFLTHIPYGGGPAGLAGVLAGDVDFMFIAIAPALPHLQSGRLVALGIGGESPHPLLPAVPPIARTYKEFTAGTWLGLFAPAGTPPAVIDKLSSDTARVLADPSLRTQLGGQGIRVTGYTGARLQSVLATEGRRYQTLVRTAGIRGE